MCIWIKFLPSFFRSFSVCLPLFSKGIQLFSFCQIRAQIVYFNWMNHNNQNQNSYDNIVFLIWRYQQLYGCCQFSRFKQTNEWKESWLFFFVCCLFGNICILFSIRLNVIWFLNECLKCVTLSDHFVLPMPKTKIKNKQ